MNVQQRVKSTNLDRIVEVLSRPGTDVSDAIIPIYRHLFSGSSLAVDPNTFGQRVKEVEELGFVFIVRQRQVPTKRKVAGVREMRAVFDLLATCPKLSGDRQAVIGSNLTGVHQAFFIEPANKYGIIHSHFDRSKLDDEEEENAA